MTTIPVGITALAITASRCDLTLAAHAIAPVGPQVTGAATLVAVTLGAIVCLALVRATRLALSLMSQFLQVAARMASTLFALAVFVVLILVLLVHR